MSAELPLAIWESVFKTLQKQILTTFEQSSWDDLPVDLDRDRFMKLGRIRGIVAQGRPANDSIVQDAQQFYTLRTVSSQ